MQEMNMARIMVQLFLFLLFLLLVDFYLFQGLKTVIAPIGPVWRKVLSIGFWALSAITMALVLATPYLRAQTYSPAWRIYPFAILIGLVFGKLLAVPFLLLDDIRRGAQWVLNFFGPAVNRSTQSTTENGDVISRSAFLSWIGLGVGASLFGTLMYGFRNQYNYKIRRLKLSFKNVPQAFRGFRIVQISDIHSGSFLNSAEVLKGVEAINGLNPDLILFTGDLVNEHAGEMEPFANIFSRLQAPFGVYSTLGNHDYGDYSQWESARAKQENFDKLRKIHADMGWKLLMDESVFIEKDGEKIGLIGVQNISGKSRFHSYGNLEKAYRNTASAPLKILMSHDPSHWDLEVRKGYPDIDLTLSGHTHGMQFGVEVPWLRWSPVQWMYKQWAGLYEEGGQKLYVNRGFGFLGYPGRVGILPEITLLELG